MDDLLKTGRKMFRLVDGKQVFESIDGRFERNIEPVLPSNGKRRHHEQEEEKFVSYYRLTNLRVYQCESEGPGEGDTNNDKATSDIAVDDKNFCIPLDFGKPDFEIKGHRSIVNNLCFHSERYYLISAGKYLILTILQKKFFRS